MEDRCICCGEIIPEGMMACPNCLVARKKIPTEKSAEQLIAEFDSKITKAEAIQIETPCLICGEGVPVFGFGYSLKICEKCKSAVMKVRAEDGK